MYKFYNDAVPSIIEKIQTFNIDIETSETIMATIVSQFDLQDLPMRSELITFKVMGYLTKYVIDV